MTTLELRSSSRGSLPLKMFLFHSESPGLASWLRFLTQNPIYNACSSNVLISQLDLGETKQEEPIQFSCFW